ncbi:hypothetical protein Rhe02_22000 [Rhizocola hellebori]|uniref:ATP-grasp domain-containing protein n=1 Tax=Rhizocola hellebori TaxID=1392758 RepID=A0A8J3Q6F6_9ACTN|nr:ATP-grasp domain-containing protein [Rhizocola hellebori]GIH04133.1 hypothetical protein Rhe02_22000 [Rhizocola hellebori]
MADPLLMLFCADPLSPARVDEHFAGQAAAVREMGGQVALIDHDALLRGEAGAAVRRVPRDSGPWWYRGWMIPGPAYADLAQALHGRGATLRVAPRRYRLAHELPGWYPTFHEVTPESDWTAWTPGEVPSPEFVAPMAGTVGPGPAVVKDYVKSRKHEWHEACFIPDTTDLVHATAVVARMVELQQESLAGGIVLRRFESYRQHDGRTAEARVWWVDGAAAMVTAHPDTPATIVEPDLTFIAPLVAALSCPFVTTDLAQRDDGVWRVVEVGDGQVSDIPPNTDMTPLFTMLAAPSTIDLPPRCPNCDAVGVPLLYGLPTPEAHAAAEGGELLLAGCLVAEDAPLWRCGHGHEWPGGEAQHSAHIGAILMDYEPA